MQATINTFEKLIDVFADAARSHDGVESFQAGDREYFFSEQRLPIFPHCFFRFTTFARSGTRLTLNGFLIVLDKLPSEAVYDNGADPFNWNRNTIVQVDATKQLLEDMIAIVMNDQRYEGNITVSGDFAATFSSKNVSSSVGWEVPVSVSSESALDTEDVPTTSNE